MMQMYADSSKHTDGLQQPMITQSAYPWAAVLQGQSDCCEHSHMHVPMKLHQNQRKLQALAMYLVQMSKHAAFALDGALPQADKVVGLAEGLLHDSIADMHAAGEAVALHATGHVDCVSQEAVARTLDAYDPSISWATVYTCTHLCRLPYRS